ncbi:fungal zn binuclear cluster domain containing protein [Stemphylium lycopersici]|nr:fungal zn binuclear cluster domain containing protein [Stemphylium lycopersici]
MSTYSQHYHPFQEQPLFIDPHAFVYGGHYDGRQRSKTPTDSLINHSGLSPGPLTTTPPVSRGPSQQRELPQDPEHMLWDNGSSSNSPTSVRTPDGESFEVEMLDSESMRSYYHHNGNNMSSQASHNAMPPMDSSMMFTDQGTFSDQAVQAAFNATMAEPQAYQQQFNIQAQQAPQMPVMNPQNNMYHQNYTTQPPRHDPWSGQGPSRSSMIPRSGHVVFDPATDHVNYSDYLIDVDSWAAHYTDPSSLISPSEPAIPNHENLYFQPPQNFAHRPYDQVPRAQPQNHSSVEMQLTRASPPPDQHNFVNYNASSSFFTDTYITGNTFPAPPSTASSAGHHPQSPYQHGISPSAPSPGSSDGMYSTYQHSDPGMMVDQFQTQQYPHLQQPQMSTLKVDYTIIGRVPEMSFDMSPEPESSQTAAQKTLAKSGGRALGTHLEPTVAKAAHDMRKIVACWHCVLQRDKCGPGEICERCFKRSQRPNADCGLGCNRMKLIDLSPYFLPSLVTQMHEDSNLTRFVTQYIQQWGNVELTVWMTCGQTNMPRIPVKVYEFVPRGDALLVQIQYKTDPTTHTRIPIQKRSPALGMVHINHNEEKKYDKYISEIVDDHLDAFGELCWMEDDNDFQQKLFKLMTRVKPKSDDEAKLLREIFRLIVVTFIMSHTLTIAEETKAATLSRMHSYGGHNSYVDNYTSPRMTNRQLKYFFSRLQRSIQATVLNKLQQIFKSSKGCDKWLAAFVAVLGMCMALEDQQKTIHLVMSTKAQTEGLNLRDAQDQADIACRDIDQRMHFVQQIFRWKYNRKCNPLRDSDQDWEKEAGFGDASSVNFVRQVAQLVKENIDFLQQRQSVSISPANQTKYTSRLVGQFLLSFWLPQV